nr:MAG TPA: hypothetical protein [Caudoviricetes sp.]
MALDYNNYKGNDDFRGFLAGNGFNSLLKYTGNDGGVDRNALIREKHPDGIGFNDANDLGREYAGVSSVVRGLYNDWYANRNNRNKPSPAPSNPQGGYYNPQAAAEAKARADEIAKYREQERVAAEGLGRLDRQRDIWRGNVENNYANQLNDLENSYTQSKGAYEMNKRDSEAQNRAVRSQIMEDANNQTNALRQMFAAGGAGDSSAAQIVAPWAVGLEASRNAGSAQDAFARDRRNQDLEFASATNAYNKNKKDWETNRQDALNNVDSQIESSRIDLNNRIMDARQKQKTANGQGLQSAIDQTRDLSNQISNSQNKILDLSKETPKALEKVDFKAPKLSDYSENVQGVKVDSGNPDQAGLQDQLDPRLAALLDPNKKKKDLQA